MSPDPTIPGQNWCVLSVVLPEEIIKRKEQFFLQNFINELLNDEQQRRFLKENEGHEISYTQSEDMYKGFLLREEEQLQTQFDKLVNFQTNIRGIKVRGVYDTEREAHYRAKQLSKRDNSFDVWVARVGQWLPFDADPNKMKDVEYNNEQLNTLMKEKRKADEERDEVFTEERKRKLERARQENEKKKKAIEIITEEAEEASKVETTTVETTTVETTTVETTTVEATKVETTTVEATKVEETTVEETKLEGTKEEACCVKGPDLKETKEKITEFRGILDEKDAIFEKIMKERREARAKAALAPVPKEVDRHGVDKDTSKSLFASDDPWLARKKEQSEKKDIGDAVKNIF